MPNWIPTLARFHSYIFILHPPPPSSSEQDVSPSLPRRCAPGPRAVWQNKVFCEPPCCYRSWCPSSPHWQPTSLPAYQLLSRHYDGVFRPFLLLSTTPTGRHAGFFRFPSVSKDYFNVIFFFIYPIPLLCCSASVRTAFGLTDRTSIPFAHCLTALRLGKPLVIQFVFLLTHTAFISHPVHPILLDYPPLEIHDLETIFLSLSIFGLIHW